MDSLILKIDAATDLPDDLIAAVVTFLERRDPPDPAIGGAAPAGVGLERLGGSAAERYLSVYRAIGERWLWFSRLAMPRTALSALLDDPAVEAFVVTRAGADIGLLELDGRAQDETELAFFGLIEREIGGGVGRWMMQEALGRAFARPIRRLFVHTCTLDHPGALDFYRRSGFRPYRRAVEIARDPRRTGALSCEAGPHAPMLTST